MSVLHFSMLAALLLGPLCAQAENRQDVQGILDAGLQRNRRGLDSARKRWLQAVARSPRDARVDYAFGLVLRKHSRTSEAERQFLAATRKTAPQYLPAHHALAWLKFARGRNADGLKRLDRLAAIVAQNKPAIDQPSRLASADWIGRAVAALEIIKLSGREKSELNRVAANAERLFTGPLRVAYDKGMRAVQKANHDRDVQAIKDRILGRRKETERQTQESKKIAGKQSSIGTSRTNLKKTAADWKEWIDERTKTSETGLKRLMKELAILEDRRQSLSRSFSLAQRERNRLILAARATARVPAGSPRRTPVLRRRGVGRRGTVNSGTFALEQQMIGYHNRLVATNRQMGQLRTSGAAALRQHRRDIKQYENATGSIVRTNSALSRWEKRLKQQEQKLKSASLRKPKAGKFRQSQIARFSTYVSFDVHQEQQTLLKTNAK